MGVYERRACGIYCRGGSGRSGGTGRTWNISADVRQGDARGESGRKKQKIKPANPIPVPWLEHVVSQAGKTVHAIVHHNPAFRLGAISAYGSLQCDPTASLILQIVWPKLQIHPQVHLLSSLVLNLQLEANQVAWAPSRPPRPLLSHCPALLLFPFSHRPLVDHVSVDSNLNGCELNRAPSDPFQPLWAPRRSHPPSQGASEDSS